MTVYYFALVDSEGNAASLQMAGPTFPDEGAWEHNNSLTVVHVTTQLSDMGAFVREKYYKDGVWVNREPPPADYYNWKNEEWVVDSTELWRLAREDRNMRLLRSDWTQSSDSPLTDTKKAEWADYRAALREVPVNNENVVLLDDITWPSEPS